MGIPSYFSYIVKNHREIIRRFVKNKMAVDNLYMDCNSIIYDAVRAINFTDDESSNDKHRIIIQKVILKIEEYIDVIAPKDTVIIAFDGVAPVAKLQQQRERRYKSWYQNEISKTIFKNTKADPWNTTAITPGTVFMRDLNESVSKHFSGLESKYGLKRIVVSGSNEIGEGEHKIFQHIRDCGLYHLEKTTVIYGLDADLIMLSINHLPVCREIYLFRETPEFIKSIDSSLEPNAHYLMDIPTLTKVITDDMNNGKSDGDSKTRVYDYIFLCFFLGNDFMPHFPALNIRTGGVDKMINAYKATVGSAKNEYLTDGKTIYWKNVRKLVGFLAQQEEDLFKEEMKLRDRREKNSHFPMDTPEEKYAKFDAIPTYERELEKFIHPYKAGWRERYYSVLHQVNIDEERSKEICLNYMQGLEWTMKYYTDGCPDWRWSYQHHYPPLLSDLIKHLPYFETTLIAANNAVAVSPLVQLCYVLPRHSLHFLPDRLYRKLVKEYSHWYRVDCDFVWAYSKYFWEAHVDLPEIDLDELEKIVHGL
jgi:5'-3' exonuclease